jgi:hypothetical protein
LEEEKRRKLKSGRSNINEENKSQLNENQDSSSQFQNDRPIRKEKVEFEDDPEKFAKYQEENLKELDDLPREKLEIADQLSQILDEEIIRHMFSTKWQQREIGFEMTNGYLGSILQKADDVISVQKLIFSIIQEGLNDKIIQVNIKAMKCCETYLSAGVSGNTKPINKLKEFEEIIVLVLDKLGSSKLSKNAESLIIKMIENPLVDLNFFIEFM